MPPAGKPRLSPGAIGALGGAGTFLAVSVVLALLPLRDHQAAGQQLGGVAILLSVAAGVALRQIVAARRQRKRWGSLTPEVPLAKRAATSCLVAPFAAMAMTVVFGPLTRDQPHAALFIAGTACLVVLVGVIAGVVALAGIRRHGTAAILWKAVVGLVVSATLVALAVVGRM